MPLSFADQLDLGLRSITAGDMELFSKVLTSPSAVTAQDQRTFAERLGIKGDFLKAAVNIGTDPLVLVGFALSRKFPTSQFLRGAIPKRFIGVNNEFTGLSSIARPVEGFFRGTNIPNLLSLKMRRETEVLKIGNRIFDRVLNRSAWQEEKDIVSSILEGQRPVGATPELQELAKSIRGDLNQLWGFLNKTKRITGGFDDVNIQRAVVSDFAGQSAPKFLRDFLPHIPLYGDTSTITISGKDAIANMGKNKIGQLIKMTQENPGNVWKLQKDGSLQSNFGDFQRFMTRVGGQVFNRHMFRRKRLGVKLQSAEGEGLFITDLDQLMQRYVHSVARTYALNAPLTDYERTIARTLVEGASGKIVALKPSADPISAQIINEGLEAAGVQIQSKQIAGSLAKENTLQVRNRATLGALRTLVRSVQGKADEGEILFGSLFNRIRQQIVDKLGNKISPGKINQLEDAISSIQSEAIGAKTSNKIASYFYATTLGLNPASAIKNLFQPLLTTAPAIGIGATLKGYGVLKQRLPKYASTFIQEQRLLGNSSKLGVVERLNLAQERAFNSTFPELAKTGIKADPRAFELSESARLTLDPRTGRGRFASSEDYFKFLLQPFTQTELSNQIVTFYGGKAALRQSLRQGTLDIPIRAGGLPLTPQGVEDFLDFQASSLVNATQFRPGPGSRTVVQSMIPAPFRMFTSFPIRLANFFSESTVRGALTQAQLENAGVLQRITGGRNLGTIARSLAIGRAVTTGLRDALGVDMGDALGLTGPFTGIVESGRIFSPLTFSPLPGVLKGIASFSSTRDVRDLNPLTLPGIGEIRFPKVLVPGGVGISRMAKALRAYRPDLGGFVDDDERLMFRGDNLDLIFGMLGIPLEKERRLREQMDRAQSNRFRVRQLRRRYTVAAVNSDFPVMEKLDQQFQKEFPDVGVGLTVSNHDVRRYKRQQRLGAAQRMIRSLGKDFNFLEQDLLQFDPELVGTDIGSGSSGISNNFSGTIR